MLGFFCIVSAGLSVCEHSKHKQLSPTYKRQATDIFTHIRTYIFTVFFAV